MSDASHLILGASRGIGRAYAKRCAVSGGRLTLVGRGRRALEDAAREFRRLGSPRVNFIRGDLLDHHFLRDLLTSFESGFVQSVFVGGPSPKTGEWDSLLPRDYREAAKIILEYPVEVLEWARGSGLQKGGTVYLLSSSTSQEAPDEDHPFFLSVLLRRALDDVVQLYSRTFTGSSKHLRVLRPKLVDTHLAKQYAAQFADEGAAEALRRSLAAHFGIEPLDAETFIDEALREY